MAGGGAAAPGSTELWGRLHRPLPAEEKLEAAAQLLAATVPAASAAPGAWREAVWLFEWLVRGGAGAGGAASKKSRSTLPPRGARLLCDLLRALPAAYPLGPHVPFLVVQLRAAVQRPATGQSESASEAAADSPQRPEPSPALEAGQEAAEAADAREAAVSSRLLALLLARPALSFRPSPEQALPLLEAAARLVVERAAGGNDVRSRAVLPLGAGMLRLLLRSLDAAAPKKVFKTALDALPHASAMLACAPRAAGLFVVPTGSAHRTASEGWDEVLSSVRALLRVLFDRSQLDGFEVLSRMSAEDAAADVDEEAGWKKKRAKLGEDRQENARGPAADGVGEMHQMGVFTRAGRLVQDSPQERCAEVFPHLLFAFVSEYRRHVALRDATPWDQGETTSGGRKRSAPQPSAARHLPCEFWFFLRLAQVIQKAMRRFADSDPDADTTNDGQKVSCLAKCLVELLRLVRQLGLYRPREDPKQMQQRALDSYCQLFVQRVGEHTHGDPEWEGLLEVLQLDASPFKLRLDEVWGLIIDSSLKKLSDPDVSCPRIEFAVQLLHTYANLADLSSCLAAVASALRSRKAKRGRRLLTDACFQHGVQAVATVVSGSAAAAQATQVWSTLLEELQGGLTEDIAASPVWWAPILLQHFVQGLRPSELSLLPFRELLIKSFEVVAPLQGDSPEGLLAALCALGQHLAAWDLPSCYRRRSGEAGVLEGHVERGLGALMGRLVHDVAGGPAGVASEGAALEPHVRLSVLWFILCEERRRDGLAPVAGAAEAGASPAQVALRVLQLAIGSAAAAAGGQGDQDDALAPDASAPSAVHPSAVSLQARRVVCARAPLLLELLGGQGRQEGGAGAAPQNSEHVSMLARVLVPADLSCWRHLAQAWREGARQPPRRLPFFEPGWWPAALLWSSHAETVSEHVGLRAVVLRRLARLLRAAATEDQASHDRDPDRQDALLGLLRLVHQLVVAPLRGMPASVVSELLQGVAACVALACARQSTLARRCGKVAADSRSLRRKHFAREVVVRALGSAKELLEALVVDTSADKDAIRAAVALFAHVDRLGSRPPSALDNLVELLASGALSDPFGAAVATATRVAGAVLAQRCEDWRPESRRRWLGQLVQELLGNVLPCVCRDDAGEKNTFCRVELPHPLEYMIQGDREAGQTVQQSFRFLLAFLRAGGARGPGAIEHSVGITLRQGPPDERLRSAAALDGASCACAGVLLAVVAQALDLGLDLDLLPGGPSCQAAPLRGRRDELVRLAAAGLRVLSAAPAAQCDEELARGVGSFIRSFCVTEWSDERDEELWKVVWVPLVADWVELLATRASTSGASPPSSLPGAPSDALAEACDGAAPAGGDPTTIHPVAALCTHVDREGREHVLGYLARRASSLAMRGVEGASDVLVPLEATMGSVAAAMQRMAQRPALRALTASWVLAALRGVLAVGAAGSGAEGQQAQRLVPVWLQASAVARALYLHLAAPRSRQTLTAWGAKRRRHPRLNEAESVLLLAAIAQARLALRLQLVASHGEGWSRGEVEKNPPAATSEAPELLASAYSSVHAIFGAVPAEGQRLPEWTKKPHAVIEVLKLMLEAAYAAPRGAEAARAAADVARLWEAYALGGTRLVSRAAGRSGRGTYQARVQRATKGSAIMIIAHLLAQQRQWPGVDAAVKRSLASLEPARRAEARAEELARWKDMVSVLQTGLVPLFASLEGSEHLMQSLYASLREPLNAMFRELRQDFQKRGRYHGDA